MVWLGARSRVACGPNSPWVRLACGSLSISSILFPSLARAPAKWWQVEVLPTPPFWFRSTMETAGINAPLPGEGSGGPPAAPDEQPRGRRTSRGRAGPSLPIGNRADRRTAFSLPGEGRCQGGDLMGTGAGGFPGKRSGGPSGRDRPPTPPADALHFPGKEQPRSGNACPPRRRLTGPAPPPPGPSARASIPASRASRAGRDRPDTPSVPPPRAAPAPGGHRPTTPAPAASPVRAPPGAGGSPHTGAA